MAKMSLRQIRQENARRRQERREEAKMEQKLVYLAEVIEVGDGAVTLKLTGPPGAKDPGFLRLPTGAEVQRWAGSRLYQGVRVTIQIEPVDGPKP